MVSQNNSYPARWLVENAVCARKFSRPKEEHLHRQNVKYCMKSLTKPSELAGASLCSRDPRKKILFSANKKSFLCAPRQRITPVRVKPENNKSDSEKMFFAQKKCFTSFGLFSETCMVHIKQKNIP